MGVTHLIEQFIELVKSTAKWAGRFNRQQFATLLVGMNLIGIVVGFLMGVTQVVVQFKDY